MNYFEIEEAADRLRTAFMSAGMSLSEMLENLIWDLAASGEVGSKKRKEPRHQKKLIFERQYIKHQVVDRKPKHLNKKIIR